MKERTRQNYAALLERVRSHIYANLDEELDMGRLAEVAGMSAYHWHRIYHALSGETIAATVKRLRLQRAAGFLVEGTAPVEQVARRAGYANLQSFTRTFREAYGMPPAQYRKHGSHTAFGAQGRAAERVTVRQLAPLRLRAAHHRGSYLLIGEAFDRLFGQASAAPVLDAIGDMGDMGDMGNTGNNGAMRCVAVFFDDPATLPPSDLRSAAGIVIAPREQVAAPLAALDVAGGPYAVLRHVGPYTDMKLSYQWLFGVWLPQSGYEPADLPLIEEYFNSPRDTPAAQLQTDICLPLRAAPSEGEVP